MSRHAQVEEVYDSDPDEVFPSDSTPSNFTNESLLSAAGISPQGASSIPVRPAPEPRREIPKHYQCLYPVYFDKSRTRAEGRKVGAELAVENPLARDIVDAAQMLGLQVGFEPEKLHPKDWANPGRVRVLLKDEDGKLANPQIKNSAFSFYSPALLAFILFYVPIFGERPMLPLDILLTCLQSTTFISLWPSTLKLTQQPRNRLTV